MKRNELPPLEKAVSDTLDKYLIRIHGITSSWAHPHEFIQWLKEKGYCINKYDQDDGEHCQSCGRPYLLVWSAPDNLWRKIVRKGEAGLRCPDCFDKECREQEIFLEWKCYPYLHEIGNMGTERET